MGGSCRIKTGQSVCIAGWLTAFCMLRSFAEGNFRTDYNVCSEIPFGGGSCRMEASRMVCVVGWLTGFCTIWVFTESFFPNRLFKLLLLVSST